MEEILQTKAYHSTIYKESGIADNTVEELSKNETEGTGKSIILWWKRKMS